MALPRMTGLAPLGLPAMDPPIPKESCYADDSCTEPVYDDHKPSKSHDLYMRPTITDLQQLCPDQMRRLII